jgi:hypothetical protein
MLGGKNTLGAKEQNLFPWSPCFPGFIYMWIKFFLPESYYFSSCWNDQICLHSSYPKEKPNTLALFQICTIKTQRKEVCLVIPTR